MYGEWIGVAALLPKYAFYFSFLSHLEHLIRGTNRTRETEDYYFC